MLHILLILLAVALAGANHHDKLDLMDAVREGHLKEVKALIKKGANVSVSNAEGVAPLFEAAFHGDTAIVKALIDAGAEVDAQNNEGETPLSVAGAFNGHARTVEALLEAGANPNVQDDEGRTALSRAVRAWSANVTTIKALLRAGAKPNIRDHEGQTPLFNALSVGKFEFSEVLAKAGGEVGPNAGQLYANVVVQTAYYGFEASLKALLEAGVDPNTQATLYFEGWFPLHGAVLSHKLGSVKELVAAGADLSAQDSTGHTPGFLAVINGQYEIVSYFLSVDHAWLRVATFTGDLPRQQTKDQVMLAQLPPEQSLWQEWCDIVRDRRFQYAFGGAMAISLPLSALLVYAEKPVSALVGTSSSLQQEPSLGAQQLAAAALLGSSSRAFAFRLFEVMSGTVLPAWTFSYFIAPWISGLFLLGLYVIPSGFIVGPRQALKHPGLCLVSVPRSIVREPLSRLMGGMGLALVRLSLVLFFPAAFFYLRPSQPLFNPRWRGAASGYCSLFGCIGTSECWIMPYEAFSGLVKDWCQPVFSIQHVWLPLSFGVLAVVLFAGLSATAGSTSSKDKHGEVEARLRPIAVKLDQIAAKAAPEATDVWKSVAALLEEEAPGSSKLVGPVKLSTFWKSPYFDLAMMAVDVFSDLYTLQNMFRHQRFCFGGMLTAVLIVTTLSEIWLGNTPLALWQARLQD